LQKEAAKQGIFAELIQWRLNLVDSSKLFNNGEEDFPQDLVESLTNSAINEIDNLINQGNQWEEKQLKPIVNRLFNICCDLMKNGMQPSALPDVIAGLGFYQPIAQGIVEAWMSVYAAHTKSSNSSSRELSDQEVRDLEKKFRIELKSRLDSMSGALLRIDNANIPIESQHLYTDLMARQLALIAPLWRISD
jgi:hypothetical protein